MSLHASRSAADSVAERLKIYAQPQRLMILSRLLDGELTVSDIDQATGIGQPALSQQLAELRRAEVVKTRKGAKQVYYRLADDSVVVCMRVIEAMFGGDAEGVRALTAALGAQPAPPLRRLPGAAAFARIG